MNISIRTNLRQAAESFMLSHKLQPDHLPDSVEEVMEHLDIEGQVMDCGERFIKIDKNLTESGFPEVVTWYEETFQIGWYTLPECERKSPQDYMPELFFDRDFVCALDLAFEISAKKNVHDLTIVQYQGGAPHKEITLEDYVFRRPKGVSQ
jgi:hypothetical protein